VVITIKITELSKDIENLSCYHAQKCLLDFPTFVAVLEYIKGSECPTVETATKEAMSSRHFLV